MPRFPGGGSGSPQSFATAYDPRGNLTDDDAHRYEYDEENRLARVCRIDGQTCGGAAGELEIEYDVLGRVIRRTSQPGEQDERTFRYVYDGLSYAVIQEWEDGIGAGGAPGLLREFVYAGSHIEPVTMIDYTDAGAEPAGTAEPFFYLRDERNCVIALVDEFGTVAESYRYDPYGRTYLWLGEADGAPDRIWTDTAWTESDNDPRPNPLSPSYLGNPFGFTGHRFSAAGLFETPFRAYAPDLGRWLQRDPLEYADGPNLLAYVLGNPLRWLDPLGLAALPGGYDFDHVDPVNLELCRALARKINNLQKEVNRRIEDLKEKGMNKNVPEEERLPETHENDGQCPSLSIRGHRSKLREALDNLNRAKKQYRDRCGGRWPSFPVPMPQPTPVPQPSPSPGNPGPMPRGPVFPPGTGPGFPQPPTRCVHCHKPDSPIYR